MMHHHLMLLRALALCAPGVTTRLLDYVPGADRFGFQRFEPNDGAVATAPPSGGPECGVPVTRSVLRAQTMDGLMVSGVWESGPGRQEFRHGSDEWVYILEGEAHVTVAGDTQTLRSGDVALFRAGLPMTWEIPEYVRKVWVHRNRRRLLTGLPRLAARRLLRRRRGAGGF
jgi:uncharacterized cupin superfamily protein